MNNNEIMMNGIKMNIELDEFPMKMSLNGRDTLKSLFFPFFTSVSQE